MTIPIRGVRSYDEYNQQYVQPSAAFHEELLRRFAINIETGTASFRNTTMAARPDPFAWLRAPTSMVPAPSFVGPIAPDPVLPPGVAETVDAVNRTRGERTPSFRAEPGGAFTTTRSRGYFGERGPLGRLRGPQVKPSELSDYDLQAEARELGIEGVGVMPRAVLEKAVGTLRPARQAKNTGDGPVPLMAPEDVLRTVAAAGLGMLESVQNAAESWGLDGSKAQSAETRSWLSTIFNQERNRKALGELKAKLRLSATEVQAAAQDKAEAMGEFVGPMLPQAALWQGIKTTGRVAAAAPVIGKSASWLFNGGLRGDVIAGMGANLIWNSQFEMPWLPKAEDVENFMSTDSPMQFLESGAAIVSTRLGNLMLETGLGALLGRLQQRGATATPAAAQPSAPPPSGPMQGPVSGPPTIGPSGPLQTTPGALVSPALGQVPLGYAAPNAGNVAQTYADDVFGWTPPATTPDVAPNNMPAVQPLQVRSTPMDESLSASSLVATPRVTAASMFEQYQQGRVEWPSEIPAPAPGENVFPNWQNTTAARYARLHGTSLTNSDGSLIALVHEGHGNTEFSYAAGGDGHLTGPGAYARDRMDQAYAEFSEQIGYGVRRASSTQGQWERINEMLETVTKQLDEATVSVRQRPSQNFAVFKAQKERMDDLIAQRDMLAQQLNEIGTPNAASHPFFAVVKRPFYYDANIPKETADEILETVKTNPQFKSVRPSLEAIEPTLNELFTQGTPRASDIHTALGKLWHTAEDGSTQVIGLRGANDILKATGYDAIHNIGGRLSREKGIDVPLYNAWNLLDPENQVVRVFSSPPLTAEAAATTAEQLTKQATIMESSTLTSIAERGLVSEVDLINANITKHPFSVQVIRGVKDPSVVMQRLSAGTVGVEGVSPSSYRLVPRELKPGGAVTFDVMVSTGRPITDDMVKTYQTHGVFKGMQGVVGSRGQEVEIVDVFVAKEGMKHGAATLTPGKTYLTVRSLDTPLRPRKGQIKKQVYTTSAESFLQKRATNDAAAMQDPTLDKLTEDFMSYAQGRLGTDAEGLLTMDSMRKLSTVFDEFAAAKNVPPAVRSLMGDLVEREMVATARAMAGPELAEIDDAVRAALDAVPTEAMDNVVQMATYRGLRAVQEPGTSRWTLRGPNATQWVFESDDAAREFLRGYDVEVRDLSPSGPVFPEISRSYEPEAVYRQGPTLEEQTNVAISTQKLLENMLRDEMGARFGATPGGLQPATALPFSSPSRTTRPPYTPPTNTTTTAPRPVGVAGNVPPGAPPIPPSIAQGAPVPGPQGPVLPSQLASQLQSASKNIAKIRHDLDNFLWQNVMPSRAFFDRMDELLEQAGAPMLAPGQDTFNLRTAISRFYNTSADQIGALTTTMNQFQSGTNRAGNVWGALDLPVAGAPRVQSRAAFMAQKNFSGREISAVAELETLGENVAGPQAWRNLQAYVATVKAQMIAGVPNPYAVPAALQPQLANIDFFMKHAARRQLRLEVPDAGTILHEYMRAYHWEQEVAPIWAATAQKWRSVANWQDFRGERVMRPLAEYVLGWMDGVENGFLPQSDAVLNGVQYALEKFGVPLTKRETMNIIGGTMSSSYRALLGWNPYSVLRDATQPLMATPWTGVGNLRDAFLEISGAKGIAAQRAAWQAALDNGWTEKGIPPILAANVDQSAISAGLPLQQQQFTPTQEKIRELGQMVGDFVHDMLPPALRSLEGTKLDPLWAYTQQGVVARVVVGNAAAKRFDEVLAQPWTVQQAVRELGAPNLSRAQARHIEELLTSGKTAEARNVFASTVADVTMNRYGVKEGAIGNHQVLGRIGTQLGGHSSHQIAMFYNLARGGVMNKTTAKMLMTIGAFTGVYKALEAETGWSWTKWHPLNWAQAPQLGGPLLRPAGELLGATTGLMGEAALAITGQESSDFNTRQIEQFFGGLPETVGKLAGTPAAGVRAGTTYYRAAQDGPESLARLFFTGDRRDQAQFNMDNSQQRLFDYLQNGGVKGKGAQ